ncbi:alpha/beta-tubulin-N-acetyltransferase 9 isoform X1 [Petromyzon marinus]|uniref:Amine oxidase n=1 Tax=Petromyzon marinus TaxID=7757 RepID=A0AAJ7TTU6_PETMA|nr:N-acetyltransferase 9 isoform X1 [Petromyzon marinus]XP_032822902.1 N-acetyltransferase 9 isoform X1 [Petromyzon marinus]XP_032822903.1 N-acetyltransferase 9 isoform X1 [Petromyzon marinus]XP_032822904.1 N-acetyltransferase 9 isoform X1 [Petromyzon marinus]
MAHLKAESEHGAEMSTDVVVVGAGISGLTAAYRLLQTDPTLGVIVLEGKERVGGRTVATQLKSASGQDTWDLGGQWVGSTQRHVMGLLKELGLDVYPQYTHGTKVCQLGGAHAKIGTYSSNIPSLSLLALVDLQLFMWKIDRLCQTVPAANPAACPLAAQLDSMTMETFKQQNLWTQAAKDALDVACKNNFGLECSQVSCLYYLSYAAAAGGFLPLVEASVGSAQEFKVKGGAFQLSSLLAKRIGHSKIILGDAVTHITQTDDGVELRTASHRKLSCQRVIVTCPTHLAAKIHYEPALPADRERLTQNMPMGHLIKFIVTYPTAFWREAGYSGEIVCNGGGGSPLSVTYDATTSRGNAALVGFIAGSQAGHWTVKTLEERREAVIKSLVKFLGEKAAGYLEYAEKDWSREPYSTGCPVNVMVPGMITYYHSALRRPFHRIHWAGTETATEWCGFMSGAVQSGARAAREALQGLRPSLLPAFDGGEFESPDLRPAGAGVPPHGGAGASPCCAGRRWLCLGAVVVAATAAALCHVRGRGGSLRELLSAVPFRKIPAMAGLSRFS